MLTLFSTPKPFRGHVSIVQRNALESWRRLDADAEIILFGDDEGAAEVCRELGLRHEPEVVRSEFGTKRLDWIFGRAQELARHEVLCYVNCDIILTRDFRLALERLLRWRSRFLLVGRRWDTDITEPLDFSRPDWETRVVARARSEGTQRFYNCVDYFAFARGTYTDLPPLVIGRNAWDHFLVGRARQLGVPIVNASDVVCAVHQNHDYAYHPQGIAGVGQDEEGQRNVRLAGGVRHLMSIEDAEFRLTPRGVQAVLFYRLAPLKRRVRKITNRIRTYSRVHVWHPFLNATRATRHWLGLRRESLPGFLKHRKPRISELDR